MEKKLQEMGFDNENGLSFKPKSLNELLDVKRALTYLTEVKNKRKEKEIQERIEEMNDEEINDFISALINIQNDLQFEKDIETYISLSKNIEELTEYLTTTLGAEVKNEDGVVKIGKYFGNHFDHIEYDIENLLQKFKN